MSEIAQTIISNWPVIVSAVLGSGVTTVALSATFNHFSKKKEENVRIQHLALKLAFLFERYAIEANERISQYQFELDAYPNMGEPTMGLPDMSQLPESADYDLLPASIYNEIQDFMDWIGWKRSEANFRHNVEGRLSGYDQSRLSTAQLGEMALKIADQVRSLTDTNARTLVFDDANIRKLLKSEVSKGKSDE